MQQMVSKSKFKAQLLEYLRLLEESKQPLVITHNGKPVAKVIPYKGEDEAKDPIQSLRGTLVFYKDPNEPVGLEHWEALK